MNRRLARLLLHSYPSEWRARYGQELEHLLCRRNLRIGDVLDVLWSGFAERMRQPFFGLGLCLLTGSAVTFITTLMFAHPLWSVLTEPVVGVLRERGSRPSLLIQVTPFEGLDVIWLGVPALVTAFVLFALILILVKISFSRVEEIEKRQWATQFFTCSGTVFVLCSVLSLLAWRNGSIAELLQLYPAVQNVPLLSIGHCFVLLTASTLGVTLLAQIPIVIFFVWRFRALRHSTSIRD